MSFRVGSGAREDVAEIAVYMDSRTSGRGEQFIAAIEQAYATIGADPRSQARPTTGRGGWKPGNTWFPASSTASFSQS